MADPPEYAIAAAKLADAAAAGVEAEIEQMWRPCMTFEKVEKRRQEGEAKIAHLIAEHTADPAEVGLLRELLRLAHPHLPASVVLQMSDKWSGYAAAIAAAETQTGSET